MSRAGSQETKSGLAIGPYFASETERLKYETEGNLRRLQDAPSISTTSVILSSSSGQMSGQLVKPKYIRVQWPRRSCSVNSFPSWSSSEKGPPMRGLPVFVDLAAACFSVRKYESIRQAVYRTESLEKTRL